MDFIQIRARYLFNFFFFFLSCESFAIEASTENPIYYPRYADEVTREFIQKVRKEYSLECYGTGGSMPTDIRSISVNFSSQKCATIDEGRKLLVKLTADFKKIIDSHEKIRPYLREYPFPIDRIDVSVSFRPKPERSKPTSETYIDYLSCIKGYFHYKKDDSSNKRYVELKKESYETAVNIVRNSDK